MRDGNKGSEFNGLTPEDVPFTITETGPWFVDGDPKLTYAPFYLQAGQVVTAVYPETGHIDVTDPPERLT